MIVEKTTTTSTTSYSWYIMILLLIIITLWFDIITVVEGWTTTTNTKDVVGFRRFCTSAPPTNTLTTTTTSILRMKNDVNKKRNAIVLPIRTTRSCSSFFLLNHHNHNHHSTTIPHFKTITTKIQQQKMVPFSSSSSDALLGLSSTQLKSSSSSSTISDQNDRKDDDDTTTLVSESSSSESNSGGGNVVSSSSNLSYNQQQLQEHLSIFPRTWIPLGSTYELNPNRPNEVYFAGNSYVTYRNTKTTNVDVNDNDNVNVDNDEWIVCDNVCPHRLAPLSEGRIVQEEVMIGNTNVTRTLLECSYHGWAYNNVGQCVRIPQLDTTTEQKILSTVSTSTVSTSTSLPPSFVRTYTTMVHKNIIWAWLWPEDILSYLLPSSSSSLPTHSDNVESTPIPTTTSSLLVDPSGLLWNIGQNCSTYTREVPYSYDTLVENIVDPSHVPWAHHGLQGKRTDAIVITMSYPTRINTTTGKTIPSNHHRHNDTTTTTTFSTNDDDHNTILSNPNMDGFTFTFTDRTMGMKRQGVGEFRAPYIVSYVGTYENQTDRTFNLTSILIPTKPGYSKIILFGRSIEPKKRKEKESSTTKEQGEEGTTVITLKKDKKKKFSLIGVLFSKLPIWLLHQLSNRFLDSDLIFLHYQERERQKRRIQYQYQQQQQQLNMNTTTTTTSSLATNQYNNNYYFTPAPADRCIIAFRRWVQKYASSITDPTNSLVSPGITNVPMERSVLFNRYVQHTEQCVHCLTVYQKINIYRRNTYGILCLAILTLPKLKYTSGILATFCIGLLQIYRIIQNSMTKGEFKHYEND